MDKHCPHGVHRGAFKEPPCEECGKAVAEWDRTRPDPKPMDLKINVPIDRKADAK